MNVCILTVCDPAYKDYIPVFLMSAHRAFPEYAIKVFYRGEVEPGTLAYASGNEIVDGFCLDMPFNKATTSTLRFCLPDEAILGYGYDYFYITDIDMLFVDESVPLHEQHLKVMAKTGFCYENFAVPSNKYTYRMPGVIFTSREWFERTRAARKGYFEYLKGPDAATSYDFDESVLFKIHKDSGLEWTNRGFEDWRWHGVHLGRYLPRKGIRRPARNINNCNEIAMIRKALGDEEVMAYMRNNGVFSEILATWDRVVSRR